MHLYKIVLVFVYAVVYTISITIDKGNKMTSNYNIQQIYTGQWEVLHITGHGSVLFNSQTKAQAYADKKNA